MKKILSFVTVLILSLSISFSQNVSNALEFDNTDDFVGVPNGTALFVGLTEFSMCGWVYPTNPDANWPNFDGYFGIKNENVCDFYVVQINGTGIEARITTNTGTYTIDPPNLSQVTINEWHHYALVYTGSELQLYLNGEFDGSVPANGTIDFDNFELTFGKLVFGGQDFYLQGKLDEITVWDKALTDLEIQEYMCIGGDPAAVPNLTAYYDFNEEEGLILPDYFGAYDGNLTGMIGDEWIISEVCESGFDATFTVIDSESNQPVENASIDVDGLVKTTNENGVAIFTNYDAGTYDFTVTKTDYYDYSATFEIIDEDIVVEVAFDPVLAYSITFVITEEPGGIPVEDAIVNLDGILHYTDASGTTIFEDYLPGSYSYVILKDGYELETGAAEVINEDLSIEIILLIDDVHSEVLHDISIYPNPTDGILNISLNNGTSLINQITISDLSGKIISKLDMQAGSNQIDLSDLQKGMYIIQIKGADKIYRSSIVIK